MRKEYQNKINIYMPMSMLTEKEQQFFICLYNYKSYCNKKFKETGSYDFKKSNECQGYINHLNYMFKNMTYIKEKNLFGELNFPNVGYKRLKEPIVTAHGEVISDAGFYICIESPCMRQTVDISEIFNYLYLLNNGCLVDGNNGPSIQTSIKEAIDYYIENSDFIDNNPGSKMTSDFIQFLSNYPLCSRVELQFGGDLSYDEAQEFINSAREDMMIK